jgi:predicted transposase/invertase (TIGR01784 family)
VIPDLLSDSRLYYISNCYRYLGHIKKAERAEYEAQSPESEERFGIEAVGNAGKMFIFPKTFNMKYLDPKNDLIFKKVFEEHPDILRSFLNSMLPLPEGQEIVELEYLSPEMIPDTFLEKFTSVDVRCKDNHGRQFLVEMQMNWTTAFRHRVLFNASNAYVTQSDKGVEFKSLKPVYALNLINENYLSKSQDYYHHYAVVNLKDSNERLDGLEFVFVELDKFRVQNIRDKKLQVLWLRFLTEVGEKTEHISPELLEQPEINKAITYILEAPLTKVENYLYEKSWDRISCERTLISAAREEVTGLSTEELSSLGV